MFSKTTGLISTKPGTKHPWVKGTQVYSNEGPRLFPRGDNYEIDEIKNSKTTGPISTKLGTNHLWVKGIQVCTNEEPGSFFKGDNYEIAKLH